jgi:hypothetical protein
MTLASEWQSKKPRKPLNTVRYKQKKAQPIGWAFFMA